MRTFKSSEEALAFLQEDVHWGNAAGTCKDPRLACQYADTGMPITMFGSITMETRAGNDGDNFYYDPHTGNSINNHGIPNRGITDYLPMLPRLRHDVGRRGSALAVSISAGDFFSPEEYREMARMLREEGAADIIEGNCSCPNMYRNGEPKPVICYDPPAFQEAVCAMHEGAGSIPIAMKLAPITEKHILSRLVEICLQYKVEYIVCANTIGNTCLLKDSGAPAIPMKVGGLGGRGLRPIVRGMISMIVPRIAGSDTKLIAVGGIEQGIDAYEYLMLGADGFAFNTALSKAGGDPEVVQDIILGNEEKGMIGLVDLLVANGLPYRER